VLYGTGDVGIPKVEAARRRLRDLNPNVEVEAHAVRLDAANALWLVRDHDLVVDGTDNFATRYLVNDACVLAGRPNVYGSVFRFEGQASVFGAADGPCYRCLYPEPPPPGLVPSCAEGGVLGVLPGLVGLVQASEALKLLLGAGEPLVGRLLLVDALHMRFREMRLRRDPDCPACGRRTIREPGEGVAACALVPPAAAGPGTAREGAGPGATGEGATGPGAGGVAELQPRELAARLRAGDPIDLVDVREAHELALGRMPGARLAPLSSFDEAIGTFAGDRDVVLVCQHGIRSVTAARWLQAAGLRRVWSLAGGLERWELEAEGGEERP
jgi:adenylyltransferase/sulfurtransferase